MKSLIAVVAVLAFAVFMGTRRNPFLSLLGQGVLFLMVLAGAGGAIFCLVFPIFSSSSDSGVMILGIVPIILVTLIPWGLLRMSNDIIKARRMTPEEQAQLIKDNSVGLEIDEEGHPMKGKLTPIKFLLTAMKIFMNNKKPL